MTQRAIIYVHRFSSNKNESIFFFSLQLLQLLPPTTDKLLLLFVNDAAATIETYFLKQEVAFSATSGTVLLDI